MLFPIDRYIIASNMWYRNGCCVKGIPFQCVIPFPVAMFLATARSLDSSTHRQWFDSSA